MTPTRFAGFSTGTISFLRGISRNNTRSWFEANRDRYSDMVVRPALALIQELGAELKRFVPSIDAEPRIGGSLFRIQRDVRFSADKSPYKTHVGIRFREARFKTKAKCEGPLFYLEFDAKSLLLGIGVKAFEPLALAAYRQALHGENAAGALAQQVAAAEADGWRVQGEMMKRPPPGLAEQELALRKGLFVARNETIPDEFFEAGFVSYCAEWFRKRLGLFNWLQQYTVERGG